MVTRVPPALPPPPESLAATGGVAATTAVRRAALDAAALDALTATVVEAAHQTYPEPEFALLSGVLLDLLCTATMFELVRVHFTYNHCG